MPLVKARGRNGGRKPKAPGTLSRCHTITLPASLDAWALARAQAAGMTLPAWVVRRIWMIREEERAAASADDERPCPHCGEFLPQCMC